MKKIAVLLVFVVLFAQFSTLAFAETNYTVKGTVSLPGNDVAPAGGIKFEISAGSNSNYMASTTVVTIPEGQKSTAYSLSVSGGQNYYIYYFIGDSTLKDFNGYVPETNTTKYETNGYYNASGMKYYYYDSTMIDPGNLSGSINLTLIKQHMISGTLSLPDGDVAPAGGLEVGVGTGYMVPRYVGLAWTTPVYFTIPAGKNSVDYSFYAKVRTTRNLFYTLSSENPKYKYAGYYCVTGTTENWADATIVDMTKGDFKANMALMSDFAEWKADTGYSVNAIVTYNGYIYKCFTAHTSMAGWEPSKAPGLWKLEPAKSGLPWAPNSYYPIGTWVIYNGHSYTCTQEHISQSNWDPMTAPALWWKEV